MNKIISLKMNILYNNSSFRKSVTRGKPCRGAFLMGIVPADKWKKNF